MKIRYPPFHHRLKPTPVTTSCDHLAAQNTGSKWPEACVGGTEFGEYCRNGHGGPMW